MKKLLCTALSAVFVAGSFASCSTPAKNYSPMITVASSDAEGDAKWLTDRLGVLKDKVYLGIGSGEFDMTEFEDDGYIIRSNDGEAVVIGKTSEGLTNGVRKYANYVDRKMSDKLDISYHEGYRIDKLTLAGVDISEYAIEYENPNLNMSFAAGEFAKMIEKACGVKPGISEKITDRKYAIEFRHSDDEKLKENGFRYFFEGSRFIIEGAVERGCLYGMARFLRRELNWMGLEYGNASGYSSNDSFLYESEHTDIPEDINVEEVSSFNYFSTYTTNKSGKKNEGFYPNIEYRSFGPTQQCCHGQQSYMWGGYNVSESQICYTDDDVYDNVYTDIRDHVENLYQTGRDSFIHPGSRLIDIAHGDNTGFCKCNNCISDFKKTGTYASSMVRFANRLSDDIAAEFPDEPPVKFGMFAYQGNSKPPKDVKPNENVWITFCSDHACSAHPIEEDCTELAWYVHRSDFYMDGYYNQEINEWMRGWAEITEHMYLWYYMLDQGPMQYIGINNLYHDIKLVQSLGIEGIFMECENDGLGTQQLCVELLQEMNLNPSMTRAEYDSLLCRILEKEYGDGWEYVSEYLDIWQTAQDKSGRCWSCWEWDVAVQPYIYDLDYVAEMTYYSLELMAKALSMACDKREIRNVELLTFHIYYNACVASYFKALDENDTAMLEVLSDMYDTAMEILQRNGLSPDKMGIFDNPIRSTIEKAAEVDWAPFRDKLPK